MRWRVNFTFLFFWLINTLQAQLPIPIGSPDEITTEAYRLRLHDSHTAIRPYTRQTRDTFFIRPAAEIHVYTLSETFGYIGIGPEIYWKNNHMALWFAAPAGAANRGPSWWTHTTLPFVGQTIQLNHSQLWIDPRMIISYQTGHFTFQAGRSKFHLGEGLNSLWLNDYSPALPFIRATVKVKHILYGYQVNYLQNPDTRYGGTIKHAFNFTHYFDFELGPLTINMFETVVQDPIDSLGSRRGLDINYLNPVIFFRAVDLMLGSPDNVLLGLGGSLKLWNKIILYGYGILDEMLVSHLIAGDKCWCLKYGANAGMKVFHQMGKNLLYLQGELASVRPYTYSHDNPILAYGNLYQPLAHPLGANFYQALAKIDIINNKKLIIDINTSVSVFGQDIDTLNYGKNIFRSYLTRVADEGITTTQGDKTLLIYTSLDLGRKITSHLWLKAGFIYTHITTQTPHSQLLMHIALTGGLLNPRWDWR